MICPSCSQENPEDAVFCGDCGNALVQESPCAGCGRLNPTGLRFCRGCGHRLAETDLSPALSPIPSPIEAIQPTSFANGRYQVKRFLGEGGKKRVYLAQDTLLDPEVAFALIKTQVLAQRRGPGHIFISHVAEDSSIAIQAAEALEAKGYNTWYYERDSVPGPAYLAQMGEAIDGPRRWC